MSASQNIPTFNGSDEKSKATDFANYFCAVRCVAFDWVFHPSAIIVILM
jgi:hypothetical protein